MTKRADYEARIAAHFEREVALKAWLDELQGIVKDGKSRTVILGLTAEETEEFLDLCPIVDPGGPRQRGPAHTVARKRHHELLDKHNSARIKDVGENVDFRASGQRQS